MAALRMRSLSKRSWLVGSSFVAVLVALGLIERTLEQRAAAQTQVMAPRFEVDPFWPKPLPNHWVVGQAIGVTVDDQDHVWIVHRDNLLGANETAASQDQPTASCCVKAPPVLEFDPVGTVVGHWGGPSKEYDWPNSNHGITVDYKGNVWIGGNEGNDAQVLKFTKAGQFIMQIGKPGQGKGSNDTENFGRAAKIFVDPKANEAYIADGHVQKVFILRRDTLEVAGEFGDGGRYPGTFYSVGSVAVDSKGNIYTGENLEGKRVQKFVLKGGGR